MRFEVRLGLNITAYTKRGCGRKRQVFGILVTALPGRVDFNEHSALDNVNRKRTYVDAQVRALDASQSDESARRVNQEYTRKVNEALTLDQQRSLRRYRTERIMTRGGFQALKLILDNAQTPFTPEQETQVQSLYAEFNRQVDQLARDSKGAPDRAQLDKLQNETLGKVVRLMTPTQRRALAASRQGSITAKARP